MVLLLVYWLTSAALLGDRLNQHLDRFRRGRNVFDPALFMSF